MKYHQPIIISSATDRMGHTQAYQCIGTPYWLARGLEVAVVTVLLSAAVALTGCKDAGKAGGSSSTGASGGAAAPAMPADAASAPPNTAPKQ